MKDEGKTKEQFINEVAELRQRIAELEAAEEERRHVDVKEQQHTQDLELLSRTAMEFVELPSEENIYQFIGEKLKELVGNAVVVINSFDKVSDSFCTRAIVGVGKHIKSVLKIIGRDPLGMSYTIADAEARRALLSGKLVEGPRGLHELSFGKIPESGCRAIEELLGLSDIYVIGFTWKGELFGSAVIITRRGIQGRPGLRSRDIVEAFIYQAAVALQRKQAEEALQKAHDELERRVEERTDELLKASEELKEEIEERKRTEQALREREAELEIKTNSLEEVNTALRVLLKRRDEDKEELEEKVLSNVKELVVPFLEKVKKGPLEPKQVAYMNILESNLGDIISPFLRNLSAKYVNLTPTEIHVADLIKEGRTTKEIGELMALSPRTIETHRKNMRKKLGIEKNKGNLRSHLLSFQ